VKIVIRCMLGEDLPAVMAIDALCFPIPWSEHAFAAEVHNVSACYLVAEAGGQVCGYLGAWMVADEAHVTTLGVHPALRRRGIGERLLAAALQAALGRSVRRISLEVRESNTAARWLYARYGFQPVSRRRQYYTDNGEDAIVMWIEDLAAPAQRQLLSERFAGLAQGE
jgi:ribosomal-protein-alanine N-acetyltransferase